MTHFKEKKMNIKNLWYSIYKRCYKTSQRDKTYIGCTMSENFKDYTYFMQWCQAQVGFGNKDNNHSNWQIDKDLLIKGNKVYSEDVCVFVPRRINSLVVSCNSKRGVFPIGVYNDAKRGKFKSQCQDGGGTQKTLGYFNTPQEAFLAYKTFKEALIKQVANEYKEQLDSRVYEALMNYEVNEND